MDKKCEEMTQERSVHWQGPWSHMSIINSVQAISMSLTGSQRYSKKKVKSHRTLEPRDVRDYHTSQAVVGT